MEDLLSQDDLNALMGGGLPETTTVVSQKEINVEDLLSQDDLNELLGGLPETTIAVSNKETNGVEELLSQDDLNTLLGLTEKTIALSTNEMAVSSDMPAEGTSSCGESMSQEEIDEMLRQFDRNI
jgi:hypothetical protein